MKKIFSLVLSLVFVFALAGVVKADKPSDVGFDDNGYNNMANLFNGTGESWALAKGLPADYLGIYAKDQLIMKWNDEWNRGNDEGWLLPPYKAWTSNEWNGNTEGGSGEVWHYKIIWVGPLLESSQYWRPGGYSIWGQFEVLMDQGMAGGEHYWFAHGTPSGYGGY